MVWWNCLEEEIPIEENPLMDRIKKQTFENIESIMDILILDIASDIPFESMESIYIRITFIGIVFVHSLTYMSSYWSTKMKSFIRFTSGGMNIH